jgi:hypothetical protein
LTRLEDIPPSPRAGRCPIQEIVTMRRVLTLTLLLALTPAASPDDKKEPAPTDLPVKAKLVAKETTFKLDTGGLSAADYKKSLQEGEKSGKLPPAPKVGLVLEITNTSDKDVQVWSKGDPVTVSLELKGPGAVSVMARRAFTQEFRVPMPVVLVPGKTLTLPIDTLTFGFRGVAQQAYWAEPGEYTLTAAFNTAVNPAPKGSTDAGNGFGRVSVKSAPLTLKVEK